MKNYKVTLDFRKIQKRIEKFKLYEYGGDYPIVFIEANDPDDACSKAVYNFSLILVRQDSSQETLDLVKEMRHDIKVTRCRIPSEETI